jgi:hypothetical protein
MVGFTSWFKMIYLKMKVTDFIQWVANWKWYNLFGKKRSMNEKAAEELWNFPESKF